MKTEIKKILVLAILGFAVRVSAQVTPVPVTPPAGPTTNQTLTPGTTPSQQPATNQQTPPPNPAAPPPSYPLGTSPTQTMPNQPNPPNGVPPAPRRDTMRVPHLE